MKNFVLQAFAILGIFLISCGGGGREDSPTAPTTPGAPAETPVSGKFTKNVLIEDFTGAWCGYCPRIAYAIEKTLSSGITAVPVAIHRGNTSPSSTSYDPFNFPGASTLENAIGISGYPTGYLNRSANWSSPEPNYTNQVKGYTGLNSDLGLAITSTVQNGNMNLDVKVKFAANMSNLKLVVYILENGLVLNQVNYTSYYGGANPIQNYVHDNVLRATLTNIMGDTITEATTSGSIVTKNYTQPVPSNISNASNMSFVAFVLDSSGKVINVRGAKANTSQTFQQNP